MKKVVVSTLLLGVCIVSTPLMLLAEDKAESKGSSEVEERKQEETLPEATIASMGTVYGNARIAIDYQGPHSKDPLPIVGSLQRLSRERCSARVANASEDATYSLRYEVTRYPFHEEASSALQRRTTLAPGEEEVREFDCEKSNAAILLRGGSLVSRAAQEKNQE